MRVHVQQAGQDGVAGEVDPARAVGHVGGRDDVGDPVVLDEHRAVGQHHAGVGVDDAVGQECDALGHAAQDTDGVRARRIFKPD